MSVDLEDIQKGANRARGVTEPDELDNKELQALAADEKRQMIQKLKEENRDRRYDRKLRSRFGSYSVCYLVWYTVFCGYLLILQGWGFYGFDLPDVVLATVVGGTAIAAIGLMGFVVRGLFGVK